MSNKSNSLTKQPSNTKKSSNTSKSLLISISICFIIIILIVVAINRSGLDLKLVELQAMAENNGYHTEYIKTGSEKACLLVEEQNENNTTYIIYIPDGVTKINGAYEYTREATLRERKEDGRAGRTGVVEVKGNHSFADSIKYIDSEIRVIGGKGLINADYMFEGCMAKSIDLKQLNTSKIEYTSFMFKGCISEIITNDQKILDAYAKRSNN